MEKNCSSELVFFVNGKRIRTKDADPEMTLLTFLRNKCQLTGTKLGCGEGGCGACTVMVSRYDRNNKTISHNAVNACLAPLCSMHGLAVTTVEGIGSTKTKLHPIQERLAAAHGSQCGFCTPGIVMSMYALLRTQPQPTREMIDETFQGNLCRCTGYRPILAGMNTFSKEFQCGMGKDCCRNQKQSTTVQASPSDDCSREIIWNEDAFDLYDSSQEPIFPSELQISDTYDKTSLTFEGPSVTWYRPTTLAELLEIKYKHPEAKLVTGNTEIGIEMKFKRQTYSVLISTSHVPELSEIQRTPDGIYVGGAITLQTMGQEMKKAIQELPPYQTKVLSAIVEMLKWFAGPQIRNVAALAGNIMTASPISDLNPLLMAAGATLHVISKGNSTRMFTMDGSFFVGYRKTVLEPYEVLTGITIPYTSKNEYFQGFKQARRRDDDIAIVNAGMYVSFEMDSDVIDSLSLSYGGMAPCTVMAKETMSKLKGRRWDEDMLKTACSLLEQDLPLPPGVPGGMESFRRTLTTSFFFKFYLYVKMELQKERPDMYVNSEDLSAVQDAPLVPSSGSQILEVGKDGEKHPVGQPLPHISGIKHTTGEAVYIDDMPPYKDELFLALVTSTKAHARIVKVDTSAALSMPGVVSYVDHHDVPGKNETGSVIKDEEIFTKELVTCQGQVIGAIVAESAFQAQKAAQCVDITYEELKPIITIESAIETGSYYEPHNSVKQGDTTAAMAKAAHVIEGEVRMGGQEHFYLETHATRAVPKGEDGDIEIFCSCQSPSEAQILVADALGIGAHKITMRVKRMGGGFGGKQTRYAIVLLPVVVAATKLGRPIRCMLDRDVDMVTSGTRHPYFGKYKAGVTSEGKIEAVDFELFSNAGNSMDLSWPVLEKALLSVDSSYFLPTANIKGHLCKTNIPSNTAYRGFGGPQGIFMMESCIQHISEKLDIPAHQVRASNLIEDGQQTPYKMDVWNANVRKCWDDVIQQSDFHRKRAEADSFNRKNRWRKRGLAVIPTKFGISFTDLVFNQAGALVNIYNDGTVLLAHSGTEMGQGLHTKMIQVASKALAIPIAKIHTVENSTATVPNMSATAASAGSDLSGMAVMNACHTLLERLAPYRKKKPDDTWEQWVNDAYFDRVSLSATGFYKTPELTGYDWDDKDGPQMPFSYFTSGAAVTEVEIDCLTGDHVVLRTDIVMDVGQSLNPAIDIGQIEGGFVQGYGLFTLEEQRYSTDGFLFTRGPGAYKIPGFADIPQEFNVTLLKGSSNPKAVYSSRAVGEPPLTLGVSAFFAIKDAVLAARKDAGYTGPFRMDSPATSERVRMACTDQFTQQFPMPTPGTFKPWAVDL